MENLKILAGILQVTTLAPYLLVVVMEYVIRITLI